MVYKRFLSLLTHSADIIASPQTYLPKQTNHDISRLYNSLIDTLSAQTDVLPDTIFESELPEMDLFFLDELEYLRGNLSRGIASWKAEDQTEILERWTKFRSLVEKWKWEVQPLIVGTGAEDDDEDDEDEEGEYAPAIVDL